MNSLKRGRPIALFTGAGVIGIVVVALVFSKDLVIQYHVYGLRIDPDYLREIIQEDEESSEHAAIHAYLETQTGQNQFLDLYLSMIEKEIKEDSSRTLVQGVVLVLDDRWLLGLRYERGGGVLHRDAVK